MALNQYSNGLTTGGNGGTPRNSVYQASPLQIRPMDPKAYQMRANNSFAVFVCFLKLLGMKKTASASGRRGFASNPKTVNCFNPKFEWFDQDVGDPLTFIASASGTSIVLKDPASVSMFKIGDLVFLPKGKEILRVIGIAGSTLTVSSLRNAANANIEGTYSDGDTIIMVSSSFGEGSDKADPIHYGANEHFNYCQIFKKSTKTTNTNEATKYYGNINQLNNQKKILFDQFLLEKERAYLLGVRSSMVDNTPGAGQNQLIRTTDGLDSFIRTNVHVSKALTYDRFMDFCRSAYEYGGDERLLLCNPAFMIELNKALKNDNTNHYELSPKAKEYGINIRRIMTCMGDMDLMVDRTMGQIYDKPTAFALETENLEEMVLRADKWEENIQLPGWDYRMDQIICETGLKVTLEKRHARWEIDADADAPRVTI